MLPFLSFLASPFVWAAGLFNQGVLNIFGFTSAGVYAGSFAAWLQSLIGNVSAGSFFALFQSAATGGYGAAILNNIVAFTSASVAVVAAFWRYFT